MAFKLASISCLLCLLNSVPCYADSLIITYHSGKTQTILLDDSIQSISALKYESSARTNSHSENAPKNKTPSNDVVPEEPSLNPVSQNNPESKAKVKFKWANPVGNQ